jgi:prevent-host-death family protein
MRLSEDIKPVTYMKTRAADLLKQVKESRRPVVITQNGEAKAVLLDVASYEELRNATMLLQLVSEGEADLRKGRTMPQKGALERVRSRLRER